MASTADVRDVLARYDRETSVRRELHDVPPYRVHEVEFGGRRAVCKVDAAPAADAATEGWVARHAARTTPLPVPEVLAVGADHYVAAYSEAVPDPDPGVDDLTAWAQTAGAGLARLHAGTNFERTGFPEAGGGRLAVAGRETWPATVRALLERRREYLAGTGYADAAERALEAVERRPSAFETPGDPVLCHGNWLPDHVGVADGGVTAVIDFEHALVAPAEYDYWRTALPLFDGPGDPAAGAFRAGYESVRDLPAGLEDRRPAYRLVNAVSYLRSLFLQDRHGPAETERHAEALREVVDGCAADLRG